MTWNELATSIAIDVERGLDKTFIAKLIDDLKIWRVRLLTDSINKHPAQREQFYQHIYSPLELNPDPSCVPAGLLCPTYRTTLTIPIPMRISDGLFDYVGSIDGFKPYRVLSGGTGHYLMGGKIPKRFYLYNDIGNYDHRIITFHNSRLIYIKHIFDDPTQVVSCTPQGTAFDCNPFDQPIPATRDVIQKMQEYTLSLTLNRPDRVKKPDVA